MNENDTNRSMEYIIVQKHLMRLIKNCEELMQHDDINVRRTAATMRNTLTHNLKPYVVNLKKDNSSLKNIAADSVWGPKD